MRTLTAPLATQRPTNKSTNHLSGSLNDAYAPSPFKFLIFTLKCDMFVCVKEATGGHADRLKGISFAYMWAIMTNRTFLIHIDKPCHLENYLQPNRLNWNENTMDIIDRIGRKNMSSVLVEMYQPVFGRKRIAGFGKKSEKTGYQVLLLENGRLVNGTLLNDLFEYKNSTDVILFKSNSFIGKVFSDNEVYHKRLKQLGMDPFDCGLPNLFKGIYDALFKLAPRLQIQYDAFIKQAKPNANTKLVCAQIRTGGKTENFQDIDIKESTINKRTKALLNFIKNNITAVLNNYKIFVTTDRKTIEDETIDFFGKATVVTTFGELTHVELDTSLIVKNKSVDCTRFDRSYLDFHLLQDCDLGVISPSGYGRLGVYRSDKLERFFMYSWTGNFIRLTSYFLSNADQ